MDDLEKIALNQLAFLARHAGKTIQGFSPEALAAMRQYSWPGNLRELGNVIERAIILSEGEVIEPDDLSETIQTGSEVRLGGKLTVEEIEAEYKGKTLSIGFNARYLIDVLGVLGGDGEIDIELKDELSPSVIRKAGVDNYLYVLMPMRL